MSDSLPVPPPTGFESAPAGPVRHQGHGMWLVRFTGRVLVVCPRCGGRALVVPRPGLAEPKYFSALLFLPRRLVSVACGALADWSAHERGDRPRHQGSVLFRGGPY
ncbi:hypothetical protein [Streptomyces sp. NPDC058401]|uniref:hypothetical protein n=1 Tax=Streptomyces sp. NPDC058401 TaxID=3346480 RepID=UPI0036609ED1